MNQPNARVIRSPRGSERTAKTWAAEAAMRMLMNNLDPEVAERPQDLVVYGGVGKAARDWAAFDRIVEAGFLGVQTAFVSWEICFIRDFDRAVG